MTEAGRPFGRFPVLNLRVVEPSEDQQGRIVNGRDIIVGGVGEHIVVSFLFGGVSPLIVFECGERNCVIEHGGDHVNERNIGNETSEQIGTHVGDGPNQQSSCATSSCEQSIRIGVLFLGEVLSTVNEVRKSVLLFHELTVLVPPSTVLLSTADMGDRIDESTIDQTQHGAAKPGRHTRAVGAVTIEIQGSSSVALYTLVVYERDGNFCAILGCGIQSLGAVIIAVKSAEDLLLLEKRLLPGPHVVIKRAVGNPHRFKTKA